MSKKLIVITVALIVVAAAWYAFRPERLFINKEVNERFPNASAANMAPMKLASGEFHAGVHETKEPPQYLSSATARERCA